MRSNPKHIVVFLLLIMAIQLLHFMGFMAYFQLNRVYIIQTLCVNKERPALKCDGKCHLKSYVSATAQEAPNPSSEAPDLPSLDFLKNFNPYFLSLEIPFLNWEKDFIYYTDATVQTGFFYQALMGRNHDDALLHPPRA